MANTPVFPVYGYRGFQKFIRLCGALLLVIWVLINLAQLAQWSTFVLEIVKLIVFFSSFALLKRAMVRRLPDAAPEAAGAVLGLAFIILWCVMILGDAQMVATSARLLNRHRNVNMSQSELRRTSTDNR